MITMITGAPGAGKSALIVSMLLEREKKGELGPAFVSGIPGLKLEHQPLPPAREWTHREIEESTGTSQAKFSFPAGSLLVVDECQRIFRPRSSSSDVPDYVSALETHRHTGIDIWLVTQKPHLVDQNVRALCGRHVHLRKTWLGRQLLEWPEVVQPDSRQQRGVAVRKRYRLPKKVFGLYESSSLHVKQKHGVPLALPLLLGVAGLAAFGVWHVYGRIQSRMHPAAAKVSDVPGRKADTAGSLGLPAVASTAAPIGTRAEDYKPRLVTRPETAPLYDQIRQPVAMPVLAGCMVHEGECSCYTQQATRVDMTDSVCRAWLKRPPFNPYKLAESERSRQPDQASSQPHRAGAVGVPWSGPSSGIPQHWTPPEATTAAKLGSAVANQ